MVPKIVFHSRENNRTTTLKTEREVLAENKVYDLVGPSSRLLTNVDVYEEITKVKTPFLLGVPRIVTPLQDQVVTDPEFKFFEISEAIFSDEFMGKITHVEWQIGRDKDFKETIYNRTLEFEEDKSRYLATNDINLTSLIGLGYIRARYLSNNIASPYTQPLRFKVANKVINQPTISAYGKGLNIEFRVSDFSVNPDNGNDIYTATLYKFYKLPKEDLDSINNYYDIDNKYLLTEFVKKATDIESNIVKFPTVINDQEVKLVAGDHLYLLQARHKGKIYTSEIGYAYIDASGLRVDKPTLKILDNELNPKIDISRFCVSNGDDEFTKYVISIYEVNDKERTEKLIHEKETIYNQYIIPTGVCRSLHTYKVVVVAYGTNYMESESAEIQFSLKEIGIKTPRINLQNLGMEPKFTLDQFKLVNCKDEWVGTEWELYIHGQLIDSDLNPITSLFKVYWTEAGINSYQFSKTELEPNTNYILKVRYVGEKYKSNWGVLEFKTTELDIIKPTLYVKLEGLNFTFDVSEYIVKGATDTPKEVWYYVAEKDTNNIEEEKYIQIGEPFKVPYFKKVLTINKKNGIKKDTKYKIVAKIIGEYFSTPFSEPVYITTENIYVKPPTVTITGYPDRVPKRPTITTSPFEVTADNDKHISTSYYLYEKTEKGLVEILKSENNTKNLTSYIILDDILKPKTNYILTVRHVGEEYGESDPVTISFRTRNNFLYIPLDGEDGMQEIIIGDDEDQNSPKYFGKIPFEKLISNRNYLGDWDGTKVYKSGEQVYYNKKLWYSLTDHNENRVPGIPTQEGVHFWKEDNREELPTYKWVLKHIGFPVGIKCSIDGLSEGYEYVGMYRDNVNSNVLKMALEGRILYIYDKVELQNICYNDLVRMNIHGTRTRTMRISNRLYYVRTMTSREYIELRKLKRLDNDDIIDIEVEKQSFVSDIDQHDNRSRLVSNEFYKTEEHSPTVRDMGYRLVLEYIPDEEEPWRYYKNSFPDFVYDRYTDTGYFGSIEGVKYNIYNELGITTGTKINKDVGFLGFYYHGKRLLVNRMPIVFGIGYRDVYDLGVAYDKDIVAPEDYKPAYISNMTLPDGRTSIYSARIMKGGAFAFEGLGIVEDNEVKASDNMCRYSEWNELLYRVSQFEPKHVDRLYSHGGYQIGSNWDDYDNINLGVFEHYSGNGCHVYVDGIVDDKYILSRGGVRLEAVHWIEKKNIRNDYGLRLVLEDLENHIPKDYIPVNKPSPDMPWVPVNPDTVIKTDPIDKYPELKDVLTIGVTTEYKAYRVKYEDLKEVTNEDVHYEIKSENKIVSNLLNLDKQLILRCNGINYPIEKVTYSSIKDNNIIEENGIIKPIIDNGYLHTLNTNENKIAWSYMSSPTIRLIQPGESLLGEEDTKNRCALYFGTNNDIIILTVGNPLNTKEKLEEFLVSIIDENGNGDRIKNYIYEVVELKAAKNELYINYPLSLCEKAYHELTYYSTYSETMDLKFALKEYTGPMNKLTTDYKAYVVPETMVEKLTDELIGFRTQDRDTKLNTILNYDLETKTFIRLNEQLLIPVDYVYTQSSGNGGYTISTIYEHPNSPYMKDYSYIIPNGLSVTKIQDTLYFYEGYREVNLNGVENDLFVDLILDHNVIASTVESKILYLEENSLKNIKIIDVDIDVKISDMENGKIYQIRTLDTTTEDIEYLYSLKTEPPVIEEPEVPTEELPTEEPNAEVELNDVEFTITKIEEEKGDSNQINGGVEVIEREPLTWYNADRSLIASGVSADFNVKETFFKYKNALEFNLQEHETFRNFWNDTTDKDIGYIDETITNIPSIKELVENSSYNDRYKRILTVIGFSNTSKFYLFNYNTYDTDMGYFHDAWFKKKDDVLTPDRINDDNTGVGLIRVGNKPFFCLSNLYKEDEETGEITSTVSNKKIFKIIEKYKNDSDANYVNTYYVYDPLNTDKGEFDLKQESSLEYVKEIANKYNYDVVTLITIDTNCSIEDIEAGKICDYNYIHYGYYDKNIIPWTMNSVPEYPMSVWSYDALLKLYWRDIDRSLIATTASPEFNVKYYPIPLNGLWYNYHDFMLNRTTDEVIGYLPNYVDKVEYESAFFDLYKMLETEGKSEQFHSLVFVQFNNLKKLYPFMFKFDQDLDQYDGSTELLIKADGDLSNADCAGNKPMFRLLKPSSEPHPLTEEYNTFSERELRRYGFYRNTVRTKADLSFVERHILSGKLVFLINEDLFNIPCEKNKESILNIVNKYLISNDYEEQKNTHINGILTNICILNVDTDCSIEDIEAGKFCDYNDVSFEIYDTELNFINKIGTVTFEEPIGSNDAVNTNPEIPEDTTNGTLGGGGR